MAAPIEVSIFIPHKLLIENETALYLFGHHIILESSVLINCTIFLPFYVKLDSENQLYKHSLDKEENFGFLGILYYSKKKKNSIHNNFIQQENTVSFVLRAFDFNAFNVENIFIKSLVSPLSCQIIIYNSSDILRASVLNSVCGSYSVSQKKNFVSFLLDSCDSSERLHHEFLCSVENRCFKKTHTQKPASTLLWFTYFLLDNIVKGFFLNQRTSWFLFQIGTSTCVGRQLHQRILHCNNIVTKKKPSLQYKNLFCAIALDILIGWILASFLFNSDIPLELLNFAIEKTNFIVITLKHLIYWLMGAPAGLKLNIPLNKALGHFFLYHIYLWEAYMTVVLPVFTFIFKLSKVIGILGLTFVLSLFNDFISIATIHIYCFYGYATRLFGYQVRGLSALWRLFRGKKWNPLRQRVDSYSYDVHQLFLGTLLFTVLLFLLPTVMVYYSVFMCLRIMVLVTQGIVSKVVNAFTIFPLYSVVARVLSSPETSGDVYLSVINTQVTLVLSLQTCQVPFSTVVKTSVPALYQYKESVTWRNFIHSIITGKIIYPL